MSEFPPTAFDEYVDAYEDADIAMQRVLKVCPGSRSDQGVQLDVGVFRQVRAGLVAAYAEQRAARGE